MRRTCNSDAYDDHGDYRGGLDDFIEFAKSRTDGATQVMHVRKESGPADGGTAGPRASIDTMLGTGADPGEGERSAPAHFMAKD
jgi:hypothetical protein